MSDSKNEIKTILEKHPDVLAKIKGALLKFTEAVVAPVATSTIAPIKLAANTAMLKDGTQVSYEGELAPSVVLNVVAADGTLSVAPDGTHELEDGTIVTVANGIISEVKKVEPAEPAVAAVETMLPQMQQAFSEMELKFSAQEKEKEALKSELSEVKEVLKSTLIAFNAIIEAPVAVSSVTKTKSIDEMDALEKRRYYKSQMKK